MNPPQKTAKAGARQAQIDESAAGQRLDNYLLGALKGVPRSHIYRLIRSGQVRVNSGRVTPKHRLKAGDRVRVPPVSVRPPAPLASSGGSLAWLEQRIVYEDPRLLVLDKPAGLAVHGGTGVALGCIEALRALRPDIKELELVHRLDRATSGCLLVAKRRSALRTVHALLREGEVEKRYITLVQGRWREAVADVSAPLVTKRGAGESRVRVATGGKAARSSFRLLETLGRTASLLEVSIATGRTHQIRVHAAHLGHPVAGDERYGHAEFNEAMRRFGLYRMFLHSQSVAFEWPETGEAFSISVPLPADLEAVITALRGQGPADRAPPP
ncbi:MAG TPA: RluA family pseudouridine synthase [Gammaproteobacteria bacterium]|nr:RluA family pseudouridine synthase [Gammaproteobacteria bacterium]